MAKPKILVLRKMSSLEYYYHNNHPDVSLHESKENQDVNNKVIEDILRQEGCEYDIVTREQIAGWMVEKYDYVFSAGGDGTAIAAAYFNHNKPQLNIKNDPKSKGALCQHNIADAVRKTLAGDYNIEEWTRQNVFLDGKFIGRPMNETLVGGKGVKLRSFARYDMSYSYNGKTTDISLANSGMVIATGTGSTGWKDVFIPFPKNSREFRIRSSFPDKPEIKVDYVQLKFKGHGGGFCLDCAEELEYDAQRDSILEIRISESPLKVIIPTGAEK